jgi:hypothetical protein
VTEPDRFPTAEYISWKYVALGHNRASFCYCYVNIWFAAIYFSDTFSYLAFSLRSVSGISKSVQRLCYWLDDRRTVDRFTAGTRYMSVLHSFKTDPSIYLATYAICFVGFLPEYKMTGEWSSFHLSWTMLEALFLLPNTSSSIGTILPLSLPFYVSWHSLDWFWTYFFCN